MNSKAPVLVLVAIIAMGVVLWGAWAIRTAGGIDPERAETLAEEAERECVLEGYGSDACERLVGANHRDCLERARPKAEGPSLKEQPYLDCMTEAFAGSTGDAGGGGSGARDSDAETDVRERRGEEGGPSEPDAGEEGR